MRAGCWARSPRRGPGHTHTEHCHVSSASYFFHKGQRFSFGDWDGAKDHGPWDGQCVTNGLDERLTEELHFSNLVDDTHSPPWATAGACLRMTKTKVTLSGGPRGSAPSHSPRDIPGRVNGALEGRGPSPSPHVTTNWAPWRLPHPQIQSPEPPRVPGNFTALERFQ